MGDTFVAHEDITFRGFGTLKCMESPERIARVVKTGEKVVVPAHYRIKFIPSADLKRKINAR